jgi:hypothetical protein
LSKIIAMANKIKSVGRPKKVESDKVLSVTFYTKNKNIKEIGGMDNARFKAKELFENHINNK